jgi:hypothetical protein
MLHQNAQRTSTLPDLCIHVSTVVLAGLSQRAQAQHQNVLITCLELSSVGTCALLQIVYVARFDHSESAQVLSKYRPEQCFAKENYAVKQNLAF